MDVTTFQVQKLWRIGSWECYVKVAGMENVSVYDVGESLKVLRSTGFEVPARDPEALEAERFVSSVDGFTRSMAFVMLEEEDAAKDV